MNTNRFSGIRGAIADLMIAEYCLQRPHPSRFVPTVRPQPFEDLGELRVGSIDFFRSHRDLGRATIDVQSFFEPVGLDLAAGVVREPCLIRISKNNGERLIHFFVPIYERASVGG